MSFQIVTLFYGTSEQRAAYAPLLRRWLAHHRAAGLGPRLVIVTRDDEPPLAPELVGDTRVVAVSIAQYKDVIRPGQPFDVKGALMCEALRAIGEAFLFLDLDAFLQREPEPAHIPQDSLIGMARDIGAIHCGHDPCLEKPFEQVKKLCAGVVWFGAAPIAARENLIKAYRRAWHELKDGAGPGIVPWTPRFDRLIEQYAWSLAAHRLGQPVLRDRWNWPPHIAAFGSSRLAIVHHEFGHSKWKGLGVPAPTNV